MSELYDSVAYNNLKFEYVGQTNDVSFYEYMDSIRFEEARKKEDEFLKKTKQHKNW